MINESSRTVAVPINEIIINKAVFVYLCVYLSVYLLFLNYNEHVTFLHLSHITSHITSYVIFSAPHTMAIIDRLLKYCDLQ